MRFINNELVYEVSKHAITYPTPININYLWGFGSISGFVLVLQVISGLLLATRYSPEITEDLAYESLDRIMRDVSNGWLLRYLHSGGASMFFIVVYIHMARALYFKSYRKIILWYSGVVIFLLMIITAFLGYVLPWGNMSLWGATVITNLLGSIPSIGSHLVLWIWGGFSVSDPTLKRFFILHFLLPMIIIALSIIHILLLHNSGGSTNPLGICSKVDNVRFYPKFIIKDLFGFILVIGLLSLFTVFWYPNALGDPDNYIKANPLVTPTNIVPEWYFLPFYAILRAIPNKLGGVICMGLSIAILFLLPWIVDFKCFSSKLCKVSQFFFWVFITDVILLTSLGSCPVEEPYILVSQFATVLYFMYFLVFLPLINFLEKKAVFFGYWDCVKLWQKSSY